MIMENKFYDTKGANRSRKLKDRIYNDQNKLQKWQIQQMIHKPLHRKHKIEKHELHKIRELNSDAADG